MTMTRAKSGTEMRFSNSRKLHRSALALLILLPLPAQSSPLLPQSTALLSPFLDVIPTSSSNLTLLQIQTTPTPTQKHIELVRRQGWSYWTSVWTTADTATYTSVFSTSIGAYQTCTPDYAAGQLPCGPSCCPQNYYCANYGQGICLYDSTGQTTTGVSGGGTVGVRPTTISGVVTTVTIAPTVTTSYGTAVSTQSSGVGPVQQQHKSGLSAGAIAGIVIGVLAGLALLMLLCFCCCVDWLLHVFGIRKRRSRSGSRRTTVVEEDEVIRRRQNGRSWYGSAAGSRYSRRRPPPKNQGVGLLGALGAGAATAGLFSMFRKKEETKVKRTDESYTTYSDYSYYTYSDDSASRDNYSRRDDRRESVRREEVRREEVRRDDRTRRGSRYEDTRTRGSASRSRRS